MIGLRDLFPSRLTVAAVIGCAILIPAAVVASWGWGVAHRDAVREGGRADELYGQIHDKGTGYADRLTTCGVNLASVGAVVERQSKAVDQLKADADAATARAQASVREAQTRARTAERQVQALMAEQPREGEGRCEAAYRLIQETVR